MLDRKKARESRLLKELLTAVREGKVEDVLAFIENVIEKPAKGFTFISRDADRASAWTPYSAAVTAAASQPDVTILRALLDRAAPVISHNNESTPLHAAVRAGLTDHVQLLVRANCDVSARDRRQRTALHLAVRTVNCEAARLLLSRGADVNAVDAEGRSALAQAALYGHVELVRLLLEFGAKNIPPGQRCLTPLHLACAEGHLPVADLIAQRADPNTRQTPLTGAHARYTGATPLHLACEAGHVETVRLLLQKLHVNTCATDDQCRGVLHATYSHPYDHTRMRTLADYDQILDLLIQNGLDLDLIDGAGDTGLHLVARNGWYHAAERLLAAQADRSRVNARGETPRDVIPCDDIEMKQVFDKFQAFASRYISPPRRDVPVSVTSPPERLYPDADSFEDSAPTCTDGLLSGEEKKKPAVLPTLTQKLRHCQIMKRFDGGYAVFKSSPST